MQNETLSDDAHNDRMTIEEVARPSITIDRRPLELGYGPSDDEEMMHVRSIHLAV